MKPDLIRDFFPYVLARVKLKPKLTRVAELRDAGKRREARALLAKVEASRASRCVKRFEETYIR